MSNVNTVNGSIDGSKLEFTLMHEHLIVKPQIDDPVYEPYTLDVPAKSTFECIEFKTHGGKSIIDMTPINYGRDISALQKISKASKINIMCATGFHKDCFMPDYVNDMTVEQLADMILDEINNGIEESGVKPAVIKCSSSFNEITANEEKCIKAAAIAQKESRLPISTHCDKGTMALEQIEILKENGADISRVIVGHVDIPKDINYLKEILNTGASIGLDHFGRELDNNDAERLEIVNELIHEGFISQIFISGDMGKKEYLKAYSGKPGLTYFTKELKDNAKRKIGERNYIKIMVDNPRQILTT